MANTFLLKSSRGIVCQFNAANPKVYYHMGFCYRVVSMLLGGITNFGS